MNKRGQVTIFVIIAIVIVAAIIGLYLIRDSLDFEFGTSEFDSIYESFDNCVSSHTREALSIAGSKGGYIENPDFVPGSEYAPFSSELSFVGIGVPYWYYVSGNGIITEQVPSKNTIEKQISEFLEVEVNKCDFSSFREQGYVVDFSDPKIDVQISSNSVKVKVDMDLIVERGESNEVKSSHEVEVTSKFGKFYEISKDIYEKELEEAFLENYSLDVMYNYAPVTGSEVSCQPLVWNPSEVVDNLREGLSSNVQALKVKNNNYELQNKDNEYFVVDFNTEENVRFLYDKNWPTKIEVGPSEGNLLIAEPIGLEEGLGVLGFCYVPYHFIYDIYHPVLVQIYDSEEIFQFPVAVVIDDSVPRNSLVSNIGIESREELEDFCGYRNTNVDVFTFDNQLNPVEASISYTCLNEKCNMGSTEITGSGAVLSTKFPQCVNGIVTAKAEGYVSGKQIISTNSPGSANVILDKLYDLNLELVVGGLELETRDKDGIAIVSFESDTYSATVVYPSQKEIKLAEGLYDVSVRVFSGSSLTIPGSSERQCIDIPAQGVIGFFGKTTETCFDISLPSQTLDNALSAGGNSEVFILEDELKSSRSLDLSVSLLPSPTTLDQVQQNYQLVDVQNIGVRLT